MIESAITKKQSNTHFENCQVKEKLSEPGLMGFYDYHDFEYPEENRGNPLILQILVQTFFFIYFCLNFVCPFLFLISHINYRESL